MLTQNTSFIQDSFSVKLLTLYDKRGYRWNFLKNELVTFFTMLIEKVCFKIYVAKKPSFLLE
ncbi:hypothetical protein KsCSTR_03820 [Candidatus Kuenenia stuttgartiensis]|uniref:Uncharacterized protein n=1 Tax=Kuenenia stuttgartiensis TaxID=174633 RepID=Q1PXU7_KUEST|nr:hypothetical protein KsCSTR_03820 [Candidatus Kuenenia stuttgartiensis]TVM01319.1 MAG: hypothetical protein CV080_05100 [Candidatus Kuenenia stuttgartiensis]CAJ72854.1 unknown protein [Candidatus Kuenenia stuttgartiensis]SOH04339.1 hypothetical protein KSMBR1_1840 [Candidatus Kuenenia stuttgartiensis]